MKYSFYIYLATCFLVTYLIRMIPFVLIKKTIKNKYIISFLYYVPYSVLSAMTIPAIFYSTEHTISAVVGTVCALIFAALNKGLFKVAVYACLSVFFCELIINVLK